MGQPAADGIFAAVDQGAQLIGNLAIEASGFDGFERHFVFPPAIPIRA